MTVELKPCPFCDARLEKIAAFSNRTADHYTHLPNDCVLDGTTVIISEREDDLARVARWNRRVGHDGFVPPTALEEAIITVKERSNGGISNNHVDGVPQVNPSKGGRYWLDGEFCINELSALVLIAESQLGSRTKDKPEGS